MVLTNITLFNLIILIIGLIILWVIISIPVYLAGKVVTGGEATFGGAMMATLLGPIVYVIVLVGVDFFLGSIIGTTANVWGYILAFIAWIAVYKSSFETEWLQAIAIALLAVVMFIVLTIVVGALFGFAVPAPFFPKL